MAFQPFGYPFEVRSSKNIAALKAALREKKKGWFDVKDGPRGWIIGPFLCLWNSAFQRFGPMVLAKISSDNGTSVIRGRAGSDLNGTLAMAAWVVILALIVSAAAREGQSIEQFAIAIGIMIFVVPFVLWMAHLDKREADTLVRFIQRTVSSPSAAAMFSESGIAQRPTATLSIDGDEQTELPTVSDLRAAIEALAVDQFLVLERAPEEYMQLLSRKDDYQLEKREGSRARHFQTHLSKGMGVDDASYDRSERAVITVMTDYLFGRSESVPITWKRVDI